MHQAVSFENHFGFLVQSISFENHFGSLVQSIYCIVWTVVRVLFRALHVNIMVCTPAVHAHGRPQPVIGHPTDFSVRRQSVGRAWDAHGASMDSPRGVHAQSIGCASSVRGVFMDSHWGVFKVCMGRRWGLHGRSLNNPCGVHRLSMEFPWVSVRCPWGVRGQSVKSPSTVSEVSTDSQLDRAWTVRGQSPGCR